MNISDWTGIVVGIVNLYLLWQQNQIFRQQNRIFSAQTGASEMPLDNSKMVRIKRYWPMLLMGLLTLTTMIFVSYDLYDRHQVRVVHFDPKSELKLVVGKEFVNEVVPLDGMEYAKCKFNDVTFKYNGTSTFSFHNNEVDGHVVINTDSESVLTTIIMMKAFGQVPSELPITVGPDWMPVPIEPPRVPPAEKK